MTARTYATIRVAIPESEIGRDRGYYEQQFRDYLETTHGLPDAEIDFLPEVGEQSDPVTAAILANSWAEEDRPKVVRGMRIAFELMPAMRRAEGVDAKLKTAQRLKDALAKICAALPPSTIPEGLWLETARALRRWDEICGGTITNAEPSDEQRAA